MCCIMEGYNTSTLSNSSNNTSNNTGFQDISIGGPEQWGFWVKFICTPIIVIVGVIGNTLSLVVMKSKTLRNKSYSHYLCALAVFDTITLIIRLVNTIDEFYVDHNGVPGLFQDFNDVVCKLYLFMEHVAYLMSSWLVVLIAVERLVAVCFPFKQVMIRKQSGAKLTILLLLVLVSLSQMFRLVMIEHLLYAVTVNIWICSPAHAYMTLYTSLDVYFYQLTLAFVLPVSIVLGCNCTVLYQIYKIKKEIKQKENLSRCNRVVRQNHRTTCMLLIVSFTYIATLLPLFTLTTIIDVSIKTKKETAWYVYKSVWPFVEVCVAISLVNYAANFFIYIVSGKRFRLVLGTICHRERIMSRTCTVGSMKEECIGLGVVTVPCGD